MVRMSQYLREADQRDQALAELERCSDCGTALQETIAGYRPTEDGPKCSDCYFERLGALAEEYPIGRHKAVRRAAV